MHRSKWFIRSGRYPYIDFRPGYYITSMCNINFKIDQYDVFIHKLEEKGVLKWYKPWNYLFKIIRFRKLWYEAGCAVMECQLYKSK
jgi:hypothetical protein